MKGNGKVTEKGRFYAKNPVKKSVGTYISCIRSAEEIDLLPGFGACCIVDSSINTFEAELSWGLFLCLSVCLFLQSCRTTMLTSLRTFVQLSIPFRLFRFRNSSGNKMGNESVFQLCYEHSLLILILLLSLIHI